jgi:hypothetical protein
MLGVRQIFTRSLLIAACVPGIVGCGGGGKPGPRTYHIVGTASYSGQPLKEAVLTVRSVDGKHAAGAKISDGKFQLDAPAGMTIVEITSMREVPGEFREDNPGERVAVKEQFIPAKYNSESTLKLEIKPDVKDAKFDLMP